MVTLSHGREATGLAIEAVLRGPVAEQERLGALAPSLGALLGGTGAAGLTADGDVRLALSEVRSIGLLTPPGPGDAGESRGRLGHLGPVPRRGGRG